MKKGRFDITFVVDDLQTSTKTDRTPSKMYYLAVAYYAFQHLQLSHHTVLTTYKYYVTSTYDTAKVDIYTDSILSSRCLAKDVEMRS